jgi:hypothetical protein
MSLDRLERNGFRIPVADADCQDDILVIKSLVSLLFHRSLGGVFVGGPG